MVLQTITLGLSMSTNINTNNNRPAYCVNRAKRRGTGSRVPAQVAGRGCGVDRQTDRPSFFPLGFVSCRRTCCALMYAKFYVDKVINDNICIVFHVMFSPSLPPLSLSLSLCLSAVRISAISRCKSCLLIISPRRISFSASGLLCELSEKFCPI